MDSQICGLPTRQHRFVIAWLRQTFAIHKYINH